MFAHPTQEDQAHRGLSSADFLGGRDRIVRNRKQKTLAAVYNVRWNRHMRLVDPRSLVFAACVVLSMAGCSRKQSAETEQPSVAMRQAAMERAQAAAQLFGSRLRDKLSGAMKQGGPVAAVEVCTKEAQLIRAEVTNESGVRVGRASDKLRNPMDAAPVWVQDWLAAQNKGQTPSGFAKTESGSARFLKPIVIEGVCLVCHGEEANIPPDVRSALQRHYPHDRATGYHLGDLRGALWAEAPARDQLRKQDQE